MAARLIHAVKFPLPSLALFVFVAFDASALDKVFNFDGDAEDVPPEGFMIEAPTDARPMVAVQRDDKAPSKDHVLAMRGWNHFGRNSLLCLSFFSDIKDGTLSVKMRHSGEPETVRTAGLVWRQQQGGVYSLEWDTLKSVLRLVVTLNGKRRVIEEKEEMALAPNEWATLAVKFQGTTITCKINGKDVLTVEDSQLAGGGKAGILLQSDATIFFDDFRTTSSP